MIKTRHFLISICTAATLACSPMPAFAGSMAIDMQPQIELTDAPAVPTPAPVANPAAPTNMFGDLMSLLPALMELFKGFSSGAPAPATPDTPAAPANPGGPAAPSPGGCPGGVCPAPGSGNAPIVNPNAGDGSTCPGSGCPTSGCPSGGCPTSGCPSGGCPVDGGDSSGCPGGVCPAS